MCSIKTIIIIMLPHCCSVMWPLKPKKTAQLCGADQVDLFTITIIIFIYIPIVMSIIVINRSSVLGISSRIGSVRLCSILSWSLEASECFLHHHNHHIQQHDDDDRHRCVEAMVFHMTTTVSSIELLVFKRFIFLPYMKAFAGIIVMIMFFFFLCLFIYFFYYWNDNNDDANGCFDGTGSGHRVEGVNAYCLCTIASHLLLSS